MMSEVPKKKRSGRPRGRRIEVWLTSDEATDISRMAEHTGMSKSSFLRALGLNMPVRSVLDLKAVAELAQVNGELGRVAGLLKIWLAGKCGQEARSIDVEVLMRELQALQGQILVLMGKVTRDR